MKSFVDLLPLILLTCVFFSAGCQQQSPSSGSGADITGGADSAACVRYAPARIDIAPLTEFVPADQTHRPRIDLYVSLVDSFGSQVKAPGRFRFELYEHVQRSAEPKGKRIVIWPHVDLTDPVTNNEYWQDFLRAYKFMLPLDRSGSKNHVLQVTYLCLTGKRLTSEFTLKNAE